MATFLFSQIMPARMHVGEWVCAVTACLLVCDRWQWMWMTLFFFYGIKVMTRRLGSLWWRSDASITWWLQSSFKWWRQIFDLQAELSKIIAAVAMRSGEGEARVAPCDCKKSSRTVILQVITGRRTVVQWFFATYRIHLINVFKQ